MKIQYLSVCIISFGLLYSCSKNQNNDFDIVCDVFNKIEKMDKSLSNIERSNIASAKISENIDENSGAYLLWDAVKYAEPELRYD